MQEAKRDPQSALKVLLDRTFFGLDAFLLLVDVESFIEFSESNIGRQKRREIRRLEEECRDIELDDSGLDIQYQDQLLEDIDYRFDVILPQRVRYAALIALTTTIEWVLLILKKRAVFEFPQKPKTRNEAVHAISVFNEKALLGLEPKILLLERLNQIRNCIVHAAGLLSSYKYENELRQTLTTLPGVKVSDLNFLGASIEIEAGFLEGIAKDVRDWLPNVEKALLERGFIFK